MRGSPIRRSDAIALALCIAYYVYVSSHKQECVASLPCSVRVAPPEPYSTASAQVVPIRRPPKPHMSAAWRHERFVVLDKRFERANSNRYCIAYAMHLAQLTNRRFVIPSMKNGTLRDPNRALLDASDFFNVSHALPSLRVVRTRDFLAVFPIEKWGDNWQAQGGHNFTIEQIWVKPSQTEAELAPRYQNQGATVLLLREVRSVNHCIRFGSRMPAQRAAIHAALATPTDALWDYMKGMVGRLPENYAAVHWRSMTHQLMKVLERWSNADKGHQAPIDRVAHHQRCATSLVNGVARVLNRCNTTELILFSDVHRGQGGYTEFDNAWNAWPTLEADRAKAAEMLAAQGWKNGDSLVADYMAEQPFAPGYSTDEGLVGLLVDHICGVAPAFITCFKKDCSHCARDISQFTKHIVGVRLGSSKTIKCATYTSWLSTEEDTSCKVLAGPRHC